MSRSRAERHDVDLFPGGGAWTEEDGRVHLIASRCSGCGKHAFPPARLCDGCGTADGLAPARLSDVGTLYSFTEIHVAPAGFTTPYVIGYVDFPEGVRVLGQVEHAAGDLRVGEPVQVRLGVIRRAAGDRDVVSYKFRKQTEARHA